MKIQSTLSEKDYKNNLEELIRMEVKNNNQVDLIFYPLLCVGLFTKLLFKAEFSLLFMTVAALFYYSFLSKS